METAPASKGYAGGFGTDLMLKDLGLARENAMAVKFDVPLTKESERSAQEQLSGNFDLGSARYGSAQSIADRRVRFRPMDYLTKQLG